MASPSRAELEAQFRNIVHVMEELRELAEVDATNLVGLIDTVEQAIESDFAVGIASGMTALRNAYSATFGAAKQSLDSHFEDWRKFIVLSEASQGDTQGIITDIFNDWIRNNITINSRDFVYGTPTAASGVGDGTIARLTVDSEGFDLEGIQQDVKTFICTQDANSGSRKSQERFRITSKSAPKDGIESPETSSLLGTGIDTTQNSVHSDDSELLNAGFDQLTGTEALPESISNWVSDTPVIGDGTDFTFDSTNIFLPAFDDNDVRRALNIKLTRTLTQKINVKGTSLNRNGAYYLQIAFNRTVGTASGTLEIHLGNQSNSVAVSAQSGYNALAVAIDADSWFKNFNEEDLDIKVVWTRTSGELLVDDILFVPFLFPDGTGYVIRPGQIPYLAGATIGQGGKKFTVTDTASTAVLSYWMARLYGRHFPNATGGGETITDP